jgi:predicted secreted Zn-dependent protease
MLLATCLAAVAVPAGAVETVRTYGTYSIDGVTLEQIERQLESRGPHVDTTGHNHAGATRMRFTTLLRYARDGNRCRIARADVTLKVKVILPRWRPRGKVEPEVRIIWDTLAEDIRNHEETHVMIAKNHARELERALRDLFAERSCDMLAARARATTAAVLEKHGREQARFDRVEKINFADRFQRLLNYRLERMAAGRK